MNHSRLETVMDFVKKYWREIGLLVILLYMQSSIAEANRNAELAYNQAAEAADHAYDAAGYASEAADNALYCAYLE